MLLAAILVLAAQTAANPAPIDDSQPATEAAAVKDTEGTPAIVDAASDGKDPNEVICRTSRVTGSLTQRRRDCRTRAQWTNIGNAAREDAESMRSFKGADRPNG